jgi:hypothetical protein
LAKESRIPPGFSLLLIGTGLYWILSSQLISSFTVLTPGLLQTNASGRLLITIIGVASVAMGLWIVQVDFDELCILLSRRDGWIFMIPIALATSDVYLTLIVLSTSSQVVELNPLVSSAIGIGVIAVVPFIVSYMALTQGLGLFMLRFGRYLFGRSSFSEYLPFVLICGVAAFGPASNLVLLIAINAGLARNVLASLGCAVLALVLFKRIDRLQDFLDNANFQQP